MHRGTWDDLGEARQAERGDVEEAFATAKDDERERPCTKMSENVVPEKEGKRDAYGNAESRP